jgi:hypothetical protein
MLGYADYKYSTLKYDINKNDIFKHNIDRDFQVLIVDEKSKYSTSDVESIIGDKLRIINKVIVKWSEEKYINNSDRIFNKKLILKEFIVYILEDINPNYNQVFNTENFQNLNMHCLNEISHKNNRCYLSSEISDFFRVTSLIFGKKLLFQLIQGIQIDIYDKDILGAYGWMDFDEFITIANMTSNWLVLRNFEFLPANFFGNDTDVDVLCENILLFSKHMNLVKRSWGIGAYQTIIHNECVPFDIRFQGDDYYDRLWEFNMLKNKIHTSENVPRMNSIDYFFSLLYHSKIQKLVVKEIYIERFYMLSREIKLIGYGYDDVYDDYKVARIISEFLTYNNYKYYKPLDVNVPENNSVMKYIDADLKLKMVFKTPLKIKIIQYTPSIFLKLIPKNIKTFIKRYLDV